MQYEDFKYQKSLSTLNKWFKLGNSTFMRKKQQKLNDFVITKHIILKIKSKMSKRKYVMRKEELFLDSDHDFLPKQPQNDKQNQAANHQKSLRIIRPSFQIDQTRRTLAEKAQQNNRPLFPQTSKDDNIRLGNSSNKKGESLLKGKNKQKASANKTNVPIRFSSSFNESQTKRRTLHQKPSIVCSNSKQSQTRQNNDSKSRIKNGSENNLSHSKSQTARTRSGHKQITSQKKQQKVSQAKDSKLESEKEQVFQQQNSNILSFRRQNQPQAQEPPQFEQKELLTIKKETGTVNKSLKGELILNFQLRLSILENELSEKQATNKELRDIISSQEQKLQSRQAQTINLLKENKELSDLLRQLEKMAQSQKIKFEKIILELKQDLKKSRDEYKILQAERDTLKRKIQRLNTQIQKLSGTVQQKDVQILSWKQKQQFLISENKELIRAYEHVKCELSEMVRLQSTERFLNEMIQKTDQQTAKTTVEISKDRCKKCCQLIFGSQNTLDELANYNLNEKFKAHIKTYQDEVKYYKEELQFVKAQHQRQIQNIRTILQCTFEVAIQEKDKKHQFQVEQLKKQVSIQQELISNYKNVIQVREQVSRQQHKRRMQAQRGKSLHKIHGDCFTDRSADFLSSRKNKENPLNQSSHKPQDIPISSQDYKKREQTVFKGKQNIGETGRISQDESKNSVFEGVDFPSSANRSFVNSNLKRFDYLGGGSPSTGRN